MHKPRKIKKKLKTQILGSGEEEESATCENLMRIQCEAVDFDWVFEGDNMSNLIKMLTTQDNS